MSYEVERYEVEPRSLERQATAVVRGRVPRPGVGEWLGEVYRDVFGYLERTGISPTGPPFARYSFIDGDFEIEAGVPVPAEVTGDGRVEGSALPGGPVVTTVHRGPYEQLPAAYEAVDRWITEHGFEPAGGFWEHYLDGPEGDPSELRTLVVEPYVGA